LEEERRIILKKSKKQVFSGIIGEPGVLQERKEIGEIPMMDIEVEKDSEEDLNFDDQFEESDSLEFDSIESFNSDAFK
jgi:hypothetical protein